MTTKNADPPKREFHSRSPGGPANVRASIVAGAIVAETADSSAVYSALPDQMPAVYHRGRPSEGAHQPGQQQATSGTGNRHGTDHTQPRNPTGGGPDAINQTVAEGQTVRDRGGVAPPPAARRTDLRPVPRMADSLDVPEVAVPAVRADTGTDERAPALPPVRVALEEIPRQRRGRPRPGWCHDDAGLGELAPGPGWFTELAAADGGWF